MLVEAASAGTEQAAIRIGRWLQRTTVGIGNADHRVIIRRRGTRLEGFQDGPAAVARTGAHAGLGIDTDQLDSGRYPERNRRLVGERELEEVARDRRRQMTAGGAPAEVAWLVVAHIDADHDFRRKADEPCILF